MVWDETKTTGSSLTATEWNNMVTDQKTRVTDAQVSSNSDVTANTAKISYPSGATADATELNILDGATLTTTELNYVDGVTSSIQDQLDDKFEGILTGQTVGGSDGDLVYLSGANTWTQADASADTTSKGLLGVRVSSTSVQIIDTYTTTGLTAGSIYYISETTGAYTTTAPTTSGSIVRIIGYALSTTELMVMPSATYIEVA